MLHSNQSSNGARLHTWSVMTHKTKREYKAHAKTEKTMALAFKKNKDFSQWMRKVPKARKQFRYEPPE